jgi:hypothetical protein
MITVEVVSPTFTGQGSSLGSSIEPYIIAKGYNQPGWRALATAAQLNRKAVLYIGAKVVSILGSVWMTQAIFGTNTHVYINIYRNSRVSVLSKPKANRCRGIFFEKEISS